MPEEKKTETPKTQTSQQSQTQPSPSTLQTTPTTDTSPLTPTGATQEQGATQQDSTTQDQTRLTDLELKEMNTLTELDEPTDEQKKRLSELQQRLPKNPAKLRNKQRT
jgi:hypothetical protein